MAVAPFLYKLVWGGQLAGEETWSCSVHLHHTDVLIPNPALYAPALEEFMGQASSGVSSLASLDFIKLNIIDPTTGRYASEDLAFTHEFSGPPGSMGAGPPQVAIAVTLMSDKQRGRGSKGRFFLPTGVQPASLDGTGRLTQIVADAVATRCKTLLDAFNAVSAPQVVIFSKVGQLVEPVTQVRVGRRLDTQRRRCAQLPEEPSPALQLA